jgi:hypothetical protein
VSIVPTPFGNSVAPAYRRASSGAPTEFQFCSEFVESYDDDVVVQESIVNRKRNYYGRGTLLDVEVELNLWKEYERGRLWTEASYWKSMKGADGFRLWSRSDGEPYRDPDGDEARFRLVKVNFYHLVSDAREYDRVRLYFQSLGQVEISPPIYEAATVGTITADEERIVIP